MNDQLLVHDSGLVAPINSGQLETLIKAGILEYTDETKDSVRLTDLGRLFTSINNMNNRAINEVN